MTTIRIASPDKSKAVQLQCVDEVRFGPAFFRPEPVGFQMPAKDFLVGQDNCGSQDSRLVFFIKYFSVRSDSPPDGTLCFIDMESGVGETVERNDSGLIQILGFDKHGVFHFESRTKGLSEKRGLVRRNASWSYA